MNTALWIVTGPLAAILLVSSAKMFVPREKMASMGRGSEWVLDFSPGALRAIGVLEVLAAAGLILPALLDIAPVLVPVTASCVALLFTGAVIMRLRRGEKATIVGDLVLLAMALFVAWGRFGPESFIG
ncbi:MAG: DoxX family protein [Micromonosporaceae bacterium]